MNYRCMKYGNSKMQNAGLYIDPSLFKPRDEQLIPGVNVPAYQDEPAHQTTYPNRVQEGISKGILEAPNADSPDEQMSAQSWYDSVNGSPSQKKKKNPYDLMRQIGIGVQGFRTGLGWIAGAVERGRQNQYDYEQQTALGQMNPMQASDFQPNPYSLYAKYGGNLNKITKEFEKGGFSNNAQYDFGSGDDDKGMMKKGGYEIDRMLILRKFLPQLLKFGVLGTNKYRNYQTGGNVFTSQQQISTANTQLRDFLQRHGDPNAGSMVVARDIGDAMPKYSYPNGMLTTKTNLPTTLPYGVSLKDIENTTDGYGYYHPQNGNFVQVDPSVYQIYGPKKPVTVPDINGVAKAYKKGGIHIKPENKGKFTDYCGGKVTGDCIEKGLDSPSATIRKRANFARNSRGWNK